MTRFQFLYMESYRNHSSILVFQKWAHLVSTHFSSVAGTHRIITDVEELIRTILVPSALKNPSRKVFRLSQNAQTQMRIHKLMTASPFLN